MSTKLHQPTTTATPNTAAPFRPFLGKFQYCLMKGHTLATCHVFNKLYPQVILPTYKRTTSQNLPHAFLTGVHNSNTSNPTWLFDSGASHHITNDINALSSCTSYDGAEELVIGDGSSLVITHVGSLTLHFPNVSFILKNVLCVPSLSCNIISISSLCVDNNITIQFFLREFVIKNSQTNIPLLYGTSNHGIYAQSEVREVVKGNTITDADIQNMNYMKLVVKETMRLHGVPILLPRENPEDCVVDGYYIPARTRILVNAWACATDPNIWENPHSFIPERFENTSIGFSGSDFEFLPFGAGRRMCPGMNFGLGTVEYVIASLLHRFDWKLPEGVKPEDLDMRELTAISTVPTNPLHIVPIPISKKH